MNNFKHFYFFLFLVSIIFILFYFSIIGFYRQSARYKCWKDKQRCLSACFNPILSKSHSQPKVLLKIVILAERKFWICLFYLVDVLHCGGGKMVSQLFHFHWCSYFANWKRALLRWIWLLRVTNTSYIYLCHTNFVSFVAFFPSFPDEWARIRNVFFGIWGSCRRKNSLWPKNGFKQGVSLKSM